MRRILMLLLALMLLCLPVSAAEAPEVCIYDTAGILEDWQAEKLEDYARDISRKQDCAVYFVTVEDFTDYGTGSVFQVSTQIFEAMDFGTGSDNSGVMLLLSMADRDYSLIAHGFGDTALTDDGKDYISEKFLDDFRDNQWYGGAMDYLCATEELLAPARSGNIYELRIPSGTIWLWSLILGGGLALIICGIQCALLKKKVRTQKTAQSYLDGGLTITRRTDRYTHTTEVRRKIEKDPPSSSSGSSGGHSHSGGYSGKSGKF